MRKVLDAVYLGAGFLAGICLVGIAILVLVQIGGRALGIFVRGADQIVEYLLAATTFLALAHTFATGGHIRIELMLEMMSERLRYVFEVICLLGAAVLTGYFAWYAIVMTWQSYQFKETASGLLAVPLWIPQIPMALGLCLLFVAVIDMLVLLLRGEQPGHLRSQSEGFEP